MRIQRAGERITTYGLGDAVRYTAPRAAAAGNGLLNNLIAYWPGNEANGDALDLHTNALHLTDVNTVTSNPGLVYATARQYTAAANEYHTRPGDDALLSTGDLDFTLAAWCRLDSLSNVALGCKWAGAGTREYLLFHNQTDHAPNNTFSWSISSTGAAYTTLDANTFGAAAINVWYLVVGWHDSVANQIGISVNDTADTAAYATGVFDSATVFRIGTLANAVYTMNGRIGPTMFWKSAGGGGGVLTAAQRTALYNSGAGLTYAAFTT